MISRFGADLKIDPERKLRLVAVTNYRLLAHGWISQCGMPICFKRYCELSLRDEDWRVALDRVVAPDEEKDMLVSTYWSGCDPQAAVEERPPQPFITAAGYIGGAEIVMQRSGELWCARETHGAILAHLVADTGGVSKRIERFPAPREDA